MKIIYDHKIFHNQIRGGPSRLFLTLAKYLSNKNVNLKIVSPIHNNEFLNEFSKQNSNLVYGKYFRKRIPYTGKIIHKLNDLISKYQYNKDKFDIYHSTYFGKPIFKSKKLVITIHDLIHEIFYKNLKSDSLDNKKKIIFKADKIICVSNNTKNDLMNFYGIEEKKIKVIYPGVRNIFLDKNYFENIDFIKFKPYILYVGSRHSYKNAKNFVKSFSLSARLKKDFKIVFFGGGKFTSEEVKFFNNLGLNEKFLFQVDGNDNCLKLFYQNAEAFIYPSLYEGFGSSPLEAMNNSCPVLSSNTSCLEEVQSNASLKFDPYNIEEIKNKIEYLIYSDEKKKALIKLGLNQIKKYSWSKCSKETLDLYTEIY